MNEAEFIADIDCAFPYTDRARALELANLAASISPNAVGMVLHEIASTPRNADAPVDIRLEVLARIEEVVPHPMIAILAPIVRRRIAGEALTESEALDAMHRIEAFPDQYNALLIAEFASPDATDTINEEGDRIRAAWNSKP